MTGRQPSATARSQTTPSFPVITLTTLGAVLVFIGLFAAGSIVLMSLGLGAIVAAGVIGVIERLIDSRANTTSAVVTSEKS